MSSKLLFLVVITGVVFCCLITAFAPKMNSTDNSPPKVTITTSGNNNGKFQWNSRIHYRINVSDEEDGSSEYNEINANEVLLKVVYLPDSSKVEKYLSDGVNTGMEHPGLSLIKISDCFNCHAAKNKLIGPSFEQIAKRYPYSPTSIEMLTKKMIDGSSGVWGETPMPPHPDLNTEQAKQIIDWVLNYNSNPDIAYFPGMEGTFRTKEKPVNDTGKGAYILTASYTDHGLKDNPEHRKRGHDSIVLKTY